MDDLISRQVAIEAIDGALLDGLSEGIAIEILSELPSAQPHDIARDIATIIENEKDMRVILKNAQPEVLEKMPSSYPLDPCETCLHKGKAWDEEPCDGCTQNDSKYEPDNGWIPVSERLPKYDGEMYLVTDYCEQINRRRIHVSYCYVNREGFWSDVPMGYKVIAWMPLPDPYKGG